MQLEGELFSKQIQIKPSKSPWICLVLFVRIGAFQGVTANPNKKNRLGSVSPLRLCAKRPSAHCFPLSPGATSRGLDSVGENAITHISGFAQKIRTADLGGMPIKNRRRG
jgi:hypothetical protein